MKSAAGIVMMPQPAQRQIPVQGNRVSGKSLRIPAGVKKSAVGIGIHGKEEIMSPV